MRTNGLSSAATTRKRWLATVAIMIVAPLTAVAQSFVNWESPHVSPLAMTPDGTRLLAVNTPDNRLEILSLAGGQPALIGEVSVGLDPISVRARTNNEAWVINHISDSISIVDLTTMAVIETIATADEPADVVFAGSPERAFVSCSQANQLQVFNAATPGAAPVTVNVKGEDPRAMAVSADGGQVYVAVFESGNGSTVLAGSHNVLGFVLDNDDGPYGGLQPVPNDGFDISPPMNPANPPPARTSLIIKKSTDGRWLDDNIGDWTQFVSGQKSNRTGRVEGWDLPDRDLAVVDTETLEISYVKRLMNHNMALAVNPANGLVTVVGTDGINEVRFEPNLKGIFTRVLLATVSPDATSAVVTDLNPHLDYGVASVSQAVRDLAVGDPRGIAWNTAGTRAYVTGMGSNNVTVLEQSGARAGATPIEVGRGPTGIIFDEEREQLYVLNKFDASISTVDLVSGAQIATLNLFDPTPVAIATGRQHLYDTHETSGLGQAACASCHTDARMDRLAWDLGDPTGEMKSTAGANLGYWNETLMSGFDSAWHPMKGPMVTQTLQDIIGKEPHHWRGDREGLEAFNGTFENLHGDDEQLSAAQMQALEDFLSSIHFPPNPYRNIDNMLPNDVSLEGFFSAGNYAPPGTPLPNGNAQRGLENFMLPNRADLPFACSTCHTLPSGLGTNTMLVDGEFVEIPIGPNGERHLGFVSTDGDFQRTLKIPHLRNIYERIGFDGTQQENLAGFGFHHDGSFDSLSRFFRVGFAGINNLQELADMIAFMLSFAGSDLPAASGEELEPPGGPDSQDTHAGVGQQLTVHAAAGIGLPERRLLRTLRVLANGGGVDLIAKGVHEGAMRGYLYIGGGRFQADRDGETLFFGPLLQRAGPGTELTFTAVPAGSGTRIGIDRDEDGVYDGDET